MGRAWLVGALVFVGALVAARSGVAWYWPLAALAVAAGSVWVLTNWRSENPSRTSDRAAGSTTDPEAVLETLKEQYAVGEIDEGEFERRLETLLENETVADVEDRLHVDREPTAATESGTHESERAVGESGRESSPSARQNRPHGRNCRHGKRPHGRR